MLPVRGRPLCARDTAQLIALNRTSGHLLTDRLRSDAPVVVFNRLAERLYAAIGDPSLIEFYDAARMERIERRPRRRAPTRLSRMHRRGACMPSSRSRTGPPCSRIRARA